MRPRRARCPGCLVTHVLLPVTVLLRRADAVEVIGAALTARAAGLGHRRIAVWLGVPAGTVRGWLRRWGSRLQAVRVHFVLVSRLAGVDRAVPKALGSPWRDVLVALGAAAAVVIARFGTAGVVGTPELGCGFAPSRSRSPPPWTPSACPRPPSPGPARNCRPRTIRGATCFSIMSNCCRWTMPTPQIFSVP